MSDVRFIIITVPPPALSTLLESARAAAASRTRTCEALAYPPHVTLRTGAVVPEDSVGSFTDGLRESLGAWRPFTITTSGLFHATYPSGDGQQLHMVAWRVVADAPLMDLHARLVSYTQYRRRPQPAFEPHLTLAFEDISERDARLLLRFAEENPEAFPPELSWPCNNVGLYRKVDFHWEPSAVFRTLETAP
jgi:2'-5' RNA ligase